MFKITQGKGFHITFASGWTVSVQFGPGNYGDHYDAPFFPYETAQRDCGERGSTQAEIWCWTGNGRDGKTWPDDPLSYQSPEQFAKIIGYAVSGNFPEESDVD